MMHINKNFQINLPKRWKINCAYQDYLDGSVNATNTLSITDRSHCTMYQDVLLVLIFYIYPKVCFSG